VSEAEERLANDPTSELWGEHRARYRFATRWAAGRRVLDVACGSGFGLQMLRQAGGRAVGIDLDARTLVDVHAHDRAAVLVLADGTRLPLSDASIDLITSFETVEHVPDARALVLELRRVLKPGGTLLLSTPNRCFGPPEHHQNPFHIQEFTTDELRSLLCQAFVEVEIYGQRPTPTYRFVPYLMLHSHWTPDELAWKVLNRLPFRVKDGIVHALTGTGFYPSEADYAFTLDRTDDAHCLLAVAR
jgi:SAM-dependent methyltransferase